MAAYNYKPKLYLYVQVIKTLVHSFKFEAFHNSDYDCDTNLSCQPRNGMVFSH